MNNDKKQEALRLLVDYISKKNRNEVILKEFFYKYSTCRQELDLLRNGINEYQISYIIV